MESSSKTVAIVQSNYVPWKGYFDLIGSADVFVIFDEVQFTRRDWRNRNLIKTPSGLQWLTVPVKIKGNYLKKISEIYLDDVNWGLAHWRAIEQNYRRALYFEEVAKWMSSLYLIPEGMTISELNKMFMVKICDFLGIETVMVDSSSLVLESEKSDRLASICLQLNATRYLTGPSALSYLNPKPFIDRGIEIRVFEYAGYPVYEQLWGQFKHEVSILDLLFNCGVNARKFMKFTNSRRLNNVNYHIADTELNESHPRSS